MILCSQAKLENDNRGINVKRGLMARCEIGLMVGLSADWLSKKKMVDYKGKCYIDLERGHVIRQMFEKVAYEK